jgi:hypothetical protein
MNRVLQVCQNSEIILSSQSQLFVPVQMAGPAVEQLGEARMAELVDALVSNTSGRKAVPVRPRLRVQKTE